MHIPMAIKGRLWIENERGVHLGRGRIKLLKAIHELGSLSKAAKELQISYRKAWNLVHEMNTHAKSPYVILQSGGIGGGKASLSEQAISTIALFEELEREHDQFLRDQKEKFEKLWT